MFPQILTDPVLALNTTDFKWSIELALAVDQSLDGKFLAHAKRDLNTLDIDLIFSEPRASIKRGALTAENHMRLSFFAPKSSMEGLAGRYTLDLYYITDETTPLMRAILQIEQGA